MSISQFWYPTKCQNLLSQSAKQWRRQPQKSGGPNHVSLLVSSKSYNIHTWGTPLYVKKTFQRICDNPKRGLNRSGGPDPSIPPRGDATGARHPFGQLTLIFGTLCVNYWVPEQLNIKAVAGACKLIDGCSLALCSASFSDISWHMPQKWNQFNCMTLIEGLSQKIVSITLRKI